MIDTTNSIESYNSQLRKVLKGKGAFPNEISVMKFNLSSNHGSPGRERSEQSSTARE